MKKLLLSVVLLALLSACASTEKKGPPADVTEAGVGSKANTTASATPVDQDKLDHMMLHDPNNILSKRSVYYDYDSYVVKDEFKPMIEAHAQFLKTHPSDKVFIQGNCDERGSREYNIALGQKRAESVKKMMSVLGVSDSQIETVSFGAEKPKAEGHDEAAWSQNRRSDIAYQGE